MRLTGLAFLVLFAACGGGVDGSGTAPAPAATTDPTIPGGGSSGASGSSGAPTRWV